MKAKALRGLSIGYSVSQAKYQGTTRIISELTCWEVSAVVLPANIDALISSVKHQSGDDMRIVLDALDGQMKQWRDEIAVKDTVSILFALADAQWKIERINKLVKEGF